MLLALAALPLLTSVQAVISILYPNSNTIWYKNTTVSMNWTTTNPAMDTFLFQVLLSNSDQSLLSGDQRIASSTNATADYVSFSLPHLEAGKGYMVTLVNATNNTQQFAKSDPFEIQDGTVANTSSSASVSGASQTQSSNNDIPNAQQTSNSFPSAFAAATSGAAIPRTIRALRKELAPLALSGISLLVGMAYML